MKYAPKKVFVIEENGYVELTYEEYCSRREQIPEYENKRFLPMYGMLMEVSESDYKAFYKEQRRQKYLLEQSVENQDISMDMLATDEFKGKEILTDASMNVAEQVVEKILLDKLKTALPLLDAEEQELLRLHFFQEIPQTELGRMYGVNQSNISRRINKILKKLKNLMGI